MNLFTKRLHIWRLAVPLTTFERPRYWSKPAYCMLTATIFGHAVRIYRGHYYEQLYVAGQSALNEFGRLYPSVIKNLKEAGRIAFEYEESKRVEKAQNLADPDYGQFK